MVVRGKREMAMVKVKNNTTMPSVLSFIRNSISKVTKKYYSVLLQFKISKSSYNNKLPSCIFPSEKIAEKVQIKYFAKTS